jgi:hypothetical protein
MEQTLQLDPPQVELRRGPLVPQTNSNLRLSSIKPLRRKPSFTSHVDSSEELPNSHESIFVAEYLSSNGSEDGSHKIESKGSTTSGFVGEIDASDSTSQLIGSTLIKYGHGTPLTTIVEQKSIATLRTTNSQTPQKSVSELPTSIIPHLLGHRDSLELPSTVTLRTPRRRKSFSADDLVLIKHSYHKACSTIELSTRCLWTVDKVYAAPRTPIIPPLERLSTPPGMPSWTASQNTPIQIQHPRQTPGAQRKRSKVQRLLGLRPNSGNSSPCSPGRFAPRGSAHADEGRNRRSATSPLPFSVVAPRFRPPRSGHGNGPFEIHPSLTSRPPDVKASSSQSQIVPSQRVPSNPGIPSLIPLATNIVDENFCRQNTKGKTRKSQHVRFKKSAADRTVVRDSVIDSNNDSDISTLINGPKQCHHHRRRVARFRSLSNNAGEISSQQVDSMNASYSIVSSSAVELDPTRLPAQLTPILEVQYEGNAVTSARRSRSETVPTSPYNQHYAAQTIQSMKPRTKTCWKCRIERLFKKIDLFMEDSTRCWWWICCGVDMDDDDEAIPSGSNQEAMMSVPRRVILNSSPAAVS